MGKLAHNADKKKYIVRNIESGKYLGPFKRKELELELGANQSQIAALILGKYKTVKRYYLNKVIDVDGSVTIINK